MHFTGDNIELWSNATKWLTNWRIDDVYGFHLNNQVKERSQCAPSFYPSPETFNTQANYTKIEIRDKQTLWMTNKHRQTNAETNKLRQNRIEQTTPTCMHTVRIYRCISDCIGLSRACNSWERLKLFPKSRLHALMLSKSCKETGLERISAVVRHALYFVLRSCFRFYYRLFF